MHVHIAAVQSQPSTDLQCGGLNLSDEAARLSEGGVVRDHIDYIGVTVHW